MKPKTKRIQVNKSSKRNKKKQIPEFNQWLKEFMDSHDDVLRELAKR